MIMVYWFKVTNQNVIVSHILFSYNTRFASVFMNGMCFSLVHTCVCVFVRRFYSTHSLVFLLLFSSANKSIPKYDYSVISYD